MPVLPLARRPAKAMFNWLGGRTPPFRALLMTRAIAHATSFRRHSRDSNARPDLVAVGRWDARRYYVLITDGYTRARRRALAVAAYFYVEIPTRSLVEGLSRR